MRGGRSNQHDKVQRARAVVAQALGDAARRDGPQAAKFVPTAKPIEPTQVKDESVRVLTIGEVAARLVISRTEVERMIAAGKMRALEAGWTVVVPISEVQTVLAARSSASE